MEINLRKLNTNLIQFINKKIDDKNMKTNSKKKYLILKKDYKDRLIICTNNNKIIKC